jgi:peptide/nickel transport system ATP-binding protein
VNALELCDVTVRYGSGRHAVTAVDAVSLSVAEGATVGIVGESGSGKSSIARALVGLVPIAAGRILIGGADVTSRAGARSRRGAQLVFQDPYGSLDPKMSVVASIAEALQGRSTGSRALRRQRVARLLEQVGLDPDSAVRRPVALSGGQRQRVAIARALAAQPRLLIADEVTSSLDVSVQASILNLLRELNRAIGLSTLFISHNIAVVRYLSDVVAVMYGGRIIEVADTDALFAAPQHPYTRQLLAAVPRLGAPIGTDVPLQGVQSRAVDSGAPGDGCRYHALCPVGPRHRPDRRVCLTQDPQLTASARTHRTACHFVAAAPSAGDATVTASAGDMRGGEEPGL